MDRKKTMHPDEYNINNIYAKTVFESYLISR